jgi:hypothetical protein
MKKLILALLMVASAAISFTCPQAAAQSNQAFPQKVYWASDYGTWQVKGQTPNTYQFQPASLCQFSQPGGGGPFNAFNTNAKVYIQDANAADSEVLTPSYVIINESLCSVAMMTAHNHFSFNLMSGTAGLQEVLNVINAGIPYPAQVILDRNWYTAVNSIPGQSASAVIAAAKGSDAAVLVDNTTAPENFYKWNGSAYALVAPAGSSIPATLNVLAGSGVVGTAVGIAPSTSGQAVLVSTAATSTVIPTTKTCALEGASTGNSTTCTWSVAPAMGEFLVCSLFNSVNNAIFSMTDSASNTYTAYGSPHNGTTVSNYTQTFYAGPISSTVTTTTVHASSGGSFLTIQCDSANNIAASSPTDGQGTVDATSSPITLSSPITPTVSGDYIYCATVANYLETLSAGPGFTAGASFSISGLNQYTTQGTVAPITPTMGGSIKNAATMTCSAFKAGTAVTPSSNAFQSSLSIINVQAQNTPVIPSPPTPSGDDYLNLQGAINTAISENRELFIPAGFWHTSAPLIAPSNAFRMRGAGSLVTAITATGTGYNTLTIGPGNPQVGPNGYLRDIHLLGDGIPGSPTGYSALQLNGTVQYDVENVQTDNDDIGVDLINNCYGSQFINLRGGFARTLNVGINLRTGGQSGSDLVFINPWVVGIWAGVSISGGGGGYHFFGGQIGTTANVAPNDATGAVILGKDYLTGATGETSADFYNTSFEDANYSWIFRAYNNVFLNLDEVHANVANPATPAIGFYENTSFGVGQLSMHNIQLSGYYAPLSGNSLLVVSGVTTSPPYNHYPVIEIGTASAGQWPTINGTPTFVTSMTDQSGLEAYATSISGQGIELQGLLLGNSGGNLEWSTNQGSTFIPSYLNPMTTSGDLLYGGSSGAATRLAGNATATDEVVVSHGVNSTGPTSKTCAAFVSGGTGNTETCTWSTAPAAGESVVCGVYNANSSTLTMTDSASNTYTAYGTQFTTANPTGYSLTFYTAPLAGSITTTTVNSTSGDYLGLQCNSATHMASSSPTDGQGSVNVGATTLVSLGSPITTTMNGDLLFCSLWGQSGVTYSAGPGFALGSSTLFSSATEYQAQATAGAITPTMASNLNEAATFTCSAFKSNSGGGTPAAPYLSNAPALNTANMFAGGTKFTASGCSNSALVGGATAGSYDSGTSGTCTVVLTTGVTAPNGYACTANDLTTTADTIKQTASSQTTATLAGTTVSGDVISFACTPY